LKLSEKLFFSVDGWHFGALDIQQQLQKTFSQTSQVHPLSVKAELHCGHFLALGLHHTQL